MTVSADQFAGVLPASVRAAVADSEWSRTATDGGQVVAARAILDTHEDHQMAGWVVGMTMFVDYQRSLSAVMNATRPEAIPWALRALAHGLAAKLRQPRKFWLIIESCVLRSPHLPDELAPVIAEACRDDHQFSREVATRLAVAYGERVRDAIAARYEGADALHKKRLDLALAAIASVGVGPAPAQHAPPTLELLLSQLVSVWRVTFAPELERAIELCGAELARLRGPIREDDSEREWLEISLRDDPADLDRLIDAPWADNPRSITTRLASLSRRGFDPRMRRLPALLATRPAEVQAALAFARREPGPARPADPVLVDEACAVTLQLEARRTILQQVAANPGDLELRAVLADALVEAGDPRGELISLCAKAARGDAKATRRAAKLTEALADHLTGSLPNIDPASRRFEGGFLVAARTGASRERLVESLDRFEWTTLVELECTHAFDPRLVTRMPLLEKLVLVNKAGLEELEELGPFPALRSVIFSDYWMPRDRELFPNLALVGRYVDPVTPDAFVEARRAGLDVLLVISRVDRVRAMLAHRRLGPPTLRITDNKASPRYLLEVARDHDHAYLASGSSARWAQAELRACVAALAASGFTHTSLHAPTLSADELEALLYACADVTGDMGLDGQGPPLVSDRIPRR